MSDGGKGDARRKGEDQDAFAKGYDLIWGNKKKAEIKAADKDFRSTFYDTDTTNKVTKTAQENLDKLIKELGFPEGDTDSCSFKDET